MSKPVTPLLTVDIIIEFDDGSVVLIERANDPFKGSLALPGGFVDIGETVAQAAIREAKEETSLDIELIRLVGIYSDPDRDPRGHTASIVYHAKPIGGQLRAESDACNVIRVRDYLTIPLAFDHSKILSDWKSK